MTGTTIRGQRRCNGSVDRVPAAFENLQPGLSGKGLACSYHPVLSDDFGSRLAQVALDAISRHGPAKWWRWSVAAVAHWRLGKRCG